jgi:O-antigen ligase
MYRSINSLAKTAEGKVSHNSYLSVLVELGLIGFILFSLILAIAFVQAWRQPKWQSWFWLTVLAVWSIGAFTLTWEARKSTWLFLSFIVLSAALTDKTEEPVVAKRVIAPGNQFGITYKEPFTR